MGKDSHNEMEKSMLSPEARQKFDELVALLATERYGPNGPPIDTTFAEMELFGHQAGRMLGRSLDEHLAEQHSDEHFQEASCPTCGPCGESDAGENKKTRPLQTLDGKIPLTEPALHCPTCDRDFFPQRIALAIDGGLYSPQVLTKAIVASAHVSSYRIGSKLLDELAGISISSRHLNNLTAKIGVELAEDRLLDISLPPFLGYSHRDSLMVTGLGFGGKVT